VLKEIFEKQITKNFIFFALLLVLIFLLRSMMNLFLLTFLFTFLLSSLQEFLYKIISKVIKVRRIFILVFIYILIATSLFLIIYRYVPIIVTQGFALVDQLKDVKITSGNSNIDELILPYIKDLDISSYMKNGIGKAFEIASGIGTAGLNIFLSFILSLFFIVEKNRILRFIVGFKKSKISYAIDFISSYGKSFINSFGKVLKTQFIISIINSVISITFLAILGFPQLLALTFMIFLLGLVPVAGVIISLFPLVIIGFKIGGMIKVVYVLIMIAVVHFIESYILNPRIMSAEIKIPVFFIFMILIVSEHFMGVWGLLIGVPLFVFFMDILGVKTEEEKKKLKNIKKIIEEIDKL